MLNRFVSAAAVAYSLSVAGVEAAVASIPAASNVGTPVSDVWPPANSERSCSVPSSKLQSEPMLTVSSFRQRDAVSARVQGRLPRPDADRRRAGSHCHRTLLPIQQPASRLVPADRS
jgi:hypothetical protein